MKIIGIIPARYASSRFPGKPLVKIKGIPMIQRVYQQAKLTSTLSEVIVATDDQRIYNTVRDFGGKVVMTNSTHQSGTDRIAEVAKQLPDANIIINIQGDEPIIDPRQIDQLAIFIKEHEQFSIATMAHLISREEELDNPNVVKVVFDQFQKALYFSRSPIPYRRNNIDEKPTPIYKHVGMYAFQRDTLLDITQLPVSQLEKTESLEQLRWLENGYSIGVCQTQIESIAVDHPEDLEKINQLI